MDIIELLKSANPGPGIQIFKNIMYKRNIGRRVVEECARAQRLPAREGGAYLWVGTPVDKDVTHAERCSTC